MPHWLYRLLPKRFLTALMFRLARIRWRPLKNLIIRAYVAITGARTDFSPEKNPLNYPSLNAFFTRPLAPDARPLAADGLLSPVDGRCAVYGPLEHGSVLQAKGSYYSLAQLLGSPRAAERFAGGSTATLYLAPDDYHRIHAPCAARLRAMHFIPGRRESVGLRWLAKIPGLFAQNERLVCFFESPDWGEFALVWVGALNVSSIATRWSGTLQDEGDGNYYDYERFNLHFERGEELGRFNLGSTVILCFQAGRLYWDETLLDGRKIRQGQTIGHRP